MRLLSLGPCVLVELLRDGHAGQPDGPDLSWLLFAPQPGELTGPEPQENPEVLQAAE